MPAGRVALCDDDLGLSRIRCLALAHDRRDYLWLGTEDGLALFDGLVWSTPRSLASLGGCVIRTLALGPDDTLWVGSEGAGLACIDLFGLLPRVALQLTEADGLPSNAVHAVCLDAHGGLWVGTNRGLAHIREGRVRRCLGVDDGLPAAGVWALCGDGQGRLWVGTAAGLAVLTAGSMLLCRSDDGTAFARNVQVTISIGLSDWLDGPHHEKMLANADAYLYAAKRAGRNRTCSAVDAGALGMQEAADLRR